MNDISTYQEDFKINSMTTDEALVMLERYGEPRLSKHGEGWHCSVEVFVTGEGVKFDVSTNYKEKSPRDAVLECLNRLVNALNDVKATK